jgi:TolB-like protein/DNA-binding winged helix-turn-helix (wHTH) protein
MNSSANVGYRFNGFRVDPARRLLFGAHGQPIPLKPKVFDTLLYLVERPGQVVDKQALLEGVWPHVVVEENNLNKAISTLRQVFGETRDEHRFIVTEPGRGYRFVARVEVLPTDTREPPPVPAEVATRPEAQRAPTPTPAIAPRDSQSKRLHVTAVLAATAAACAVAIGAYWFARLPTEAVDVGAPTPLPHSIAVLPFDNLSPAPDDAHFAVGLHEAILSQLANIREIHLIARASVLGYDDTQKPIPVIARELNVETVLDGSVRYADGQVLVTMHLSDGATNTSLWSGSYAREFSAIFTIQNDIALEVARALKTELLPAERARVVRAPTTSLPAYTFYLQAAARQRRATREEHLLAIDDVEQALKLDSEFAAAWVLAANLRTGAAAVLDPGRAAEHLSRAEQAARRALDLDPELAAAHAALGFALAMKTDWTGGEVAFREARRRNASPGEIGAYAMLNLSVANFPRARELMEEERHVNPHDSVLVRGLMAVNAWLGDWDVAHAYYDSGTRLFAPWPEGDTIMMHLEIGRNEVARAGAIPVAGPINAAMIARLDDPQAALRELHRLYADPVVAGPPLNRRDIALWAGHFGDPPLAFAAMRSVVTEASGRTLYLWMLQLKEMRQLPDFKALLREIGIVAHWQEYGWPDICRPLGNDDFECD